MRVQGQCVGSSRPNYLVPLDIWDFQSLLPPTLRPFPVKRSTMVTVMEVQDACSTGEQQRVRATNMPPPPESNKDASSTTSALLPSDGLLLVVDAASDDPLTIRLFVPFETNVEQGKIHSRNKA